MYRYSTLLHFYEHFYALLSTLRNERDHCTLMAMVKKRVDLKDHVEIEYSSILTPYALSYVSKQLSLRTKVTIISEHEQECHVSSSEGILKVTVDGCRCSFWNTTKLPCRHIFAVRERKRHLLFAPSLVAKRWTKDYMKNVYYKKSDSATETSCSVSSAKICSYRITFVTFTSTDFKYWSWTTTAMFYTTSKIPQKPDSCYGVSFIIFRSWHGRIYQEV